MSNVTNYIAALLFQGKDTASKLQRQVSLIRQGVAVPEFSRSGRRLDKRERMLILAKQMFSRKKGPNLLVKKELPSQVLEADTADDTRPDLPDDVLYLLKSVKYDLYSVTLWLIWAGGSDHISYISIKCWFEVCKLTRLPHYAAQFWFCALKITSGLIF